ncbi:response regulator [Lentisphaera profundi]|uniref:Response regulator n=1 Tax=Lentisphaera profundi TaxID=1658616 RepID=A0ABY7VTX5_9BACT|nr:response regulator [Lentisphaera profundi]WDE96764.1 response regulator [Lentisphaera profundi]
MEVSNKNILVIDDNPVVLEILKDCLNKEGYTVKTADDGLEAVNLVDNFTPAGIITDIVMPNMEGLETITKMRQLFPEVKIIAITGKIYSSGFDNLETAKVFGADATVRKPFSCQDVIAELDKLLA